MFGVSWLWSVLTWCCESWSWFWSEVELATARGRAASETGVIASQEAENRALRRQIESLESTVFLQKKEIEILAAVNARNHARIKAEIADFAARAEHPPSALP